MDQAAIGSRIKAARERAHLTQEQLAEIVDISPTHMSVIERAFRGHWPPSPAGAGSDSQCRPGINGISYLRVGFPTLFFRFSHNSTDFSFSCAYTNSVRTSY